MNYNIILAILEVKGIISNAEAVRIAEHVANAPLSTYYKDALDTAVTLLDVPAPPILPQLGPVGPEQAAEEAAARAAQPVAPAGATPEESKPQTSSESTDEAEVVDADKTDKEPHPAFPKPPDASKTDVKKATDTTKKK